MNFSNLKALGAQFGQSLSELEHTLAQSTANTSPSTSSSRPSLDQQHAATARPQSPLTSPGGSHVSASSVADSFRERLRKQRASLDSNRPSPASPTRAAATAPTLPPPAPPPAPAPASPTPPSTTAINVDPPTAEQTKPDAADVVEEEEEEEDGWGLEEAAEEGEEEEPPVHDASEGTSATMEQPDDASRPAEPPTLVDEASSEVAEISTAPIDHPLAPAPIEEPSIITTTAPSDPPPIPSDSVDSLIPEPAPLEPVEIPAPLTTSSSPPAAASDPSPLVELESTPASAVAEHAPALSEEPEELESAVEGAPPEVEESAMEQVMLAEVPPKVEGMPLGVQEALEEQTPADGEGVASVVLEEEQQEEEQEQPVNGVPSEEGAVGAALGTGLAQPIAEPLPEVDVPPTADIEVVDSEPLVVSPDVAEEIVTPPPASVATSTAAKDVRLAEITTAYKHLQTLKSALDRIVSDVLPLSGVSDVEAFEGELRNLKGKAEMSTAEVGRLANQLQLTKERTDEMRDTHRLESKSQSEELDALRTQLAEKDAALQLVASQLAASEGKNQEQVQRLGQAGEEHDKLKLVAKEEEEKRVKALSLLRALRQKLVKSEKDREELEKEREGLRMAQGDAGEALKVERARFEQEVVSLRAAQELQLTKLRSSFERETASIRLQGEKEAGQKREKWELEVITVKAQAAKEVKEKEARIRELEKTVREVGVARDGTFESLQMRTAEMESSRERQEALEAERQEMEYELREAKDRLAALGGEVDELKKARRDVSREDTNVRRLLAEAEVRHEAKVRDLEARAQQLEKDRQETEEEMGRNLQERLREVEKMRASLAQKDVDYAESVHSSRQREQRIEEGEVARRELQARLKSVEAMLASVKEDAERSAKAEAAVREELGDRSQRASELEGRLEEVQSKESSLRSSNKTLRDELRKLQSGVLLSEKQRNPGVGYFSSFNQSTAGLPTSPDLSSSSSPHATPTSSMKSPTESTTTSNGGVGTGDEALNFEYLRNVILQFLERPEMRPHLVSVLGVILHFTPSESRRLAAKAGA